jgi:monoamine oxidase
MNHEYDVIIVGAGFAGSIAARECATRGYRTLVLEGRDRIGGRSGGRRMKDGSYADVGGTFVHWSQPHTWSEITRYGLTDDVVRGIADLEWFAMLGDDGEVMWLPYEIIDKLNRSAFGKVMGEAARVVPNPSNPLQESELAQQADAMSVADALKDYDLTPEEHEILADTLGNYAGRPADDASWLQILRWFAGGNDNYDDYQDMTFTWKLAKGTGDLLDAIISDGGAEVRLNTRVAGVHSSDEGVRVDLEAGGSVTARACVIATPANVWPDLDLTPELPAAQRVTAEQGMAATSNGKCVVVIKGEKRALQFVGNQSLPYAFFTSSFRGPDEQIVQLFTADPKFNVSDPELIKSTIEKALPHVTVLESVGDMYTPDDPMFRGSYGFLGRGQLTEQVPYRNFTRLDERVVFATGDISRLFTGAFFDGAIESGLRAAGDIRAYLGAPGVPTP